MSRNYQAHPELYAYLLPFMSREDREIHEELCGRGMPEAQPSISKARRKLKETLDRAEYGHEEIDEVY